MQNLERGERPETAEREVEVAPMASHRPRLEENYVTTSEDLTIRYISVGTGPTTIVLIPGWTMNGEVFEHQLLHLGQNAQYNVIAYDPRSHGKSSMTDEGNHYLQHGKDLLNLLNALNVTECVLVGWSAGSGDIISYIREAGHQHILALVLVDIPPSSRGYDYKEEWVEFGTKDNGDQDGLLKFFCSDLLVDRQRITEEFVKWMLEAPTDEAVEFFSRMSLATPTETAAVLNMSYWFIDGGNDIRALDGIIPMLFVVREEREAVARKWIAENCPHAMIDAFGKHLMFWEHPNRFNTTLDQFLSVSISELGQRNFPK